MSRLRLQNLGGSPISSSSSGGVPALLPAVPSDFIAQARESVARSVFSTSSFLTLFYDDDDDGFLQLHTVRYRSLHGRRSGKVSPARRSIAPLIDPEGSDMAPHAMPCRLRVRIPREAA